MAKAPKFRSTESLPFVNLKASSLKSVKDVVRYARLVHGVNKRETVTLIGQFYKEIKY